VRVYIVQPEKRDPCWYCQQSGQLLTGRNLSVLDIYDLISKSEPDDVRWEKVEQFKLILTKGAYSVPPEQVATTLIEKMLEPCPSPSKEQQVK
jgi:hypothetical protein